MSEQLRRYGAVPGPRCRRSPSSRRAPRSRWSARSRAWSPAATSGSPSPRQRGQGGAREVRGVRPRRAGLRRRQGRLRRRATSRRARLRRDPPDLVPSGEQSAAGLLADFPPYDDVLDPIDRVLLPRADIATETLAAGLRELGWDRRRHGLPHRAGRPAAGRDPRRDQVRRLRRGLLHLVLDRAQPGRHRRQAARPPPSSPASARRPPRPPRSTACGSTCWPTNRRRPRWPRRWPSSAGAPARRRAPQATRPRRRPSERRKAGRPAQGQP
jgi:hypothetical protein